MGSQHGKINWVLKVLLKIQPCTSNNYSPATILGLDCFSYLSNCFLCRGDTLTEIAKRYSTTVRRLAADNGIENVDFLQFGEKLVVAKNTAHTKASAKSVRALRTATASGYGTSTFSHVGERSPVSVGTLVRELILDVSEYVAVNKPSI